MPAKAFPLNRADGSWVECDEREELDRRALGFISRTDLFRDVPYDELETIVTGCKMVDYAAGEMVVAAGQYGRRVWVVTEGTLHVHLDGPDSDDILEIVCGECVGEISVADGKASSAWVKAAADCHLLEIDADTFLERLLTIPRIGRNLISILAERMRRSNQRISERVRMEMELKTLQRELDYARRIQASMLPANPLLPDEPRLDSHGFMRAARQVGGDFFDTFRLDDHRYLFVVGDVCNKGMPAALFMAKTLAILRSLALRFLGNPELKLEDLAGQGNDQLNMLNSEQLFVSVFVSIVDLERGEIRYVNAGHNPPILKLPGEPPHFIDLPRNPIAGMVPGLSYRSGSAAFPPDSLLLLYTDGVTEAETVAGLQFGEEALIECVASRGGPAAALVDDIVALIDDHAAGHPQSDDITLMAVLRA
jgi:serine phosphatase RsbU (regulator of sigma subunit)